MTKQMRKFIIVMSTVITVITMIAVGLMHDPFIVAMAVCGLAGCLIFALICYAIWEICGD